MTATPIKLITLDLDHTLWDPDAALQRGEKESHAWLAAQHPAFGEQFPADAFVGLRMQLREQYPALKNRVSEIRRIAFQQALQQTGMDTADSQRLAEQAFDVFWQARQQVNIFSDTPALLEQLSQHFVPAPDMFLAALEHSGVAPCEALHIGDHPVDDMQGAQAVGMKTLWVNFAETPWPLATAAPDLTVTSLPMILEALLPPAR